MMADNIDLFRGYADRIATFAWADSRHETIAWSMLATPVGTTPADVVAAATRACPDAPKILSASSFSSTSAWDTQTNVEFVVNEAEIRSIDRRVSMLTASLAGGARIRHVPARRFRNWGSSGRVGVSCGHRSPLNSDSLEFYELNPDIRVI